MTVFEQQTSGIRRDHSPNSATTTAPYTPKNVFVREIAVWHFVVNEAVTSNPLRVVINFSLVLLLC